MRRSNDKQFTIIFSQGRHAISNFRKKLKGFRKKLKGYKRRTHGLNNELLAKRIDLWKVQLSVCENRLLPSVWLISKPRSPF